MINDFFWRNDTSIPRGTISTMNEKFDKIILIYPPLNNIYLDGYTILCIKKV